MHEIPFCRDLLSLEENGFGVGEFWQDYLAPGTWFESLVRNSHICYWGISALWMVWEERALVPGEGINKLKGKHRKNARFHHYD